jgi:MFS family permease
MAEGCVSKIEEEEQIELEEGGTATETRLLDDKSDATGIGPRPVADVEFDNTNKPTQLQPSTTFVRGSVAWHRGFVLAMCCLCYVFTSVAYDSTRVLQLQISNGLKITELQIGIMFGAYALPNAFVVVAGILVDRINHRRALALFVSLTSLGMLMQVVAVMTENFPLLVVARFVFGLGGESIFICFDAFLSLWFNVNHLPFAMSVYIASGEWR